MDPQFDRGNLKIPEMYADWLVTTGGGTAVMCFHFRDGLTCEGVPSAQTMWSLTALRCSELPLLSLPTICRIKACSDFNCTFAQHSGTIFLCVTFQFQFPNFSTRHTASHWIVSGGPNQDGKASKRSTSPTSSMPVRCPNLETFSLSCLYFQPLIFNAAIRMTAKSESLQSNRPDNRHMNVWELYILDTIDWNVEAKPTLLLWETISVMNEILAMAFEFWQPDISHDIQLFKEGARITQSTQRTNAQIIFT